MASVEDGASRGTGVPETLLEEGDRSPMRVEFLNHEGSTLLLPTQDRGAGGGRRRGCVGAGEDGWRGKTMVVWQSKMLF